MQSLKVSCPPKRSELLLVASAGARQPLKTTAIPRGDKSSYTDKQKRQAEHIEEGYESRGVPHDEAERRAWATVNKETHKTSEATPSFGRLRGKKSGSDRGEPEDHAPSRKGGRLAAGLPRRDRRPSRSRSAKKAARTRKRRAAQVSFAQVSMHRCGFACSQFLRPRGFGSPASGA
jgi:hypothetical protein